MITLDFETEAIEGNPLVTPPKPVGLAVWDDCLDPCYITNWGEMHSAWSSYLSQDHPDDLLFHNAPFDLSVGCAAFGTVWPSWERIHDTMFLLFLADPYAASLSLKPSAERYLGEPPNEQDALHDWIMSNVPEATKRTAGAYISRAPVDLVRPYAIGDVVRTKGLYDHLTGEEGWNLESNQHS
jgi:hypothetical protein